MPVSGLAPPTRRHREAALVDLENGATSLWLRLATRRPAR